jgi:hypothetical protein
MPDFAPHVSDEQVSFFEHNGYLAIDRITTEDEVERLKEIYDRIFEQRTGEDKGLYFDLGGPRGHEGGEVLPQVLSPERAFPELLETTYHRNARLLGSRLLGAALDETRWFGHMILKPAGFGRETPWHQDEAYWDPSFEHRGVSVWMPLENATVQSGCMQFVPGSHLREVQTHKHIDDDPTVHGLMLDGGSPEGAVACPIPAGGATFHHCRILHYAGPNTTERPRRAYITVVNAPATKREAPLERPWLEAEREALRKQGG